MTNNRNSFVSNEIRDIYNRLLLTGKECAPRGQKIIECENFSYKLSPYTRFTNFADRKMNLDYIKHEFLWYLRGDKKDVSIAHRAKMWEGLINTDGTINSNYGQYIFFGRDNLFDRVVENFKKDKDSRRGAITILAKDHLLTETNDVPCTYSISFRIRDNKLNMTVNMRSQDAIYGMTNDIPAFSFTHEMMLKAIQEFYPELEYGEYHHNADSFHVYERHFDMIEKLVGGSPYASIDCPEILDHNEVKFLRAGNFESIPEEYKFTKWLNAAQ